MRELVKQETIGSVCLIEMRNGRDNQLSRPLCLELRKALEAALEDGSVDLVLWLSDGELFSTGFPLADLSSEAYQSEFFALVDVLAGATKPVIAGLGGDAFGAGFELALLCAFRLAAPEVKVGFPEVSLGLPPGAGATQILPRILGVDAALGLLHAQAPVRATSLEAVVDAEIQGDFKVGALRFAQAMSGQDLRGFAMAERNDGMEDPIAFQSGLIAARAELTEVEPVRADVVNALESALLLPFSAGLAFEREVFVEAEMRPESRARRHVADQRRQKAANGAMTEEGGKPAVHALLNALLSAAEHIWLRGTPIEEIDAALYKFGMEKGPFELADQMGLDRLHHANGALPDALQVDLKIMKGLVASEEIGVDSEAGYYLYDEGYKGQVNPEAALMCENLSEGRIARQSEDAIVEACLAAVMNAGCGLLAEGLISHPGAIDLLAINQLGFREDTGGPMHATETRGILHLRYQLGADQGQAEPHPRLLDFLKNGLNFSALNREADVVS